MPSAESAEGASPVVRSSRRPAQQSDLRKLFLPTLFLAAVLYLPWLALSRFEPRQDILRTAVPWLTFLREQAFAGRLPAWDPARLAGTPFLANLEAAAFYPVTWLLLPFPPHVAAGLSLVLHVALGGVLLALFARSLPISDEAAALAGAAFVVGAWASSRVFAGHLALVQSLAWIPLILLAARRLAETASPRWAAVLGASGALALLGGSAGFALLAVAAASILFFTCSPAAGRPESLRALALAVIAAILAGFLVMPALWPAVELWGESTRAQGLVIEDGAEWPLEIGALPLTVWPWIFGAEPLGNYSRAGQGSEAAYGHEVMGASGLVLWVLAVIGAVAYRRERIVGAIVGLIVVALLLALGTRSPLFVWLYELIPILSIFGSPARFLLLPALFVPVLAALGLQEVLDRRDALRDGTLVANHLRGPSGRRLRLGVALVAVTSLLLAARESTRDEVLSYFGGIRAVGALNVVLSIVALLAFGVLVQYSSRARRSERFVLAGLYAFTLAELLLVAVPSVYARSEQVPVWLQDPRVGRPLGLPAPLGRVAIHREYSGYANWAGLRGYRSPLAYDPLLLDRTTTLLRGSQSLVYPKGSNAILLEIDGAAAFDVLGVGTFVNRVNGRDRVDLSESFLHRVGLIAPSRYVRTKAESLSAVLQPGFDYRFLTILERQPAMLPASRPAGSTLVASVLGEEPGVVRIRASTPTVTHLLFSESYYPGWVAEEGGRTVDLVPANHAIMAARLAPGTHDLTLRFTTPWLWPSLIASLLGIAGLALLASAGRLRFTRRMLPRR